jgi:hypothetical protein
VRSHGGSSIDPLDSNNGGQGRNGRKRLSALRASVEPRSEELKTIRLRHHDFLLDTRIFRKVGG